MNTGTVQKLLKNSYEKGGKQKKELDGYLIDPQLSGRRAQVYFNNDTNKAVVIHRGTQGVHDFVTDGLLSLGIKTKRFKHGQKIQDKAIEKYGKDNITTLGHSLGAVITEDVNRGTNTITLNKPVLLQDINKKISDNQIDIKSKNDPVSFLRQYQQGKKAINIPSRSASLLNEHKTDVLGRLSNKEIEFK
jgi:hypothetical protein